MRFYGSYFKEPVSEIFASALVGLKGRVICNPPIERATEYLKRNHLFVWDQIPHWSDYFVNLRDHRNLVKELIWAKVNPSFRLTILQSAKPIVAVHVRCGDFRRLGEHENFKHVGLTRTPLSYFVTLINEIRRCLGNDVPVTVFTDGFHSEIGEVLSLPAVTVAPQNEAIVDLLLMSRAQLIITSAGSTFSYWAGFLADSPVLLHPEHIHASHRPQFINNLYYEGAATGEFENWPHLLIRNIKEIKMCNLCDGA